KNEELRLQREWFEVTLASIGDAVITTDTQGRITFMNRVAESMTGWRKDEALGRELESVLSLRDERGEARFLHPVQEVLRTGQVVGLGGHAVLRDRSGREVAIEDSAAPIRDTAGTILGV